MTLTPEQFNKIATKEDLKGLREEMVTKKDHNQTMNAIDEVMVKLNNIEHAFVSNLSAHDRFEKRIIRVEKHLELTPS